MINVIRTKYTAFQRKPTFNIILAHPIGRFVQTFLISFLPLWLCLFLYKTFKYYRDSKNVQIRRIKLFKEMFTPDSLGK